MTTDDLSAEALLRAMVGIRSDSGKEHDLARYLVQATGDLGLTSHVDEAGNAIARRGPATGPMIMLLGHLDTVPGQDETRLEGRTLHGRGAVDAKGPLAAMICAAARANLGDAQIVVAGTVQEETTGHGAAHLAATFAPDVAIVGEPNGWSGVGIGYKGRITLRYEVTRPAVHTARLEEKATEAAVRFWNRLSAHLAEGAADLRVFDRPIATLYEMSGTIERAALEIWCRTPPEFDVESFERFLRDIAEDGDLTVDDRTPGVRVDPSSAAVRALCSRIRARGARPTLKLKSGTADLNVVGERWKIPMAVYGPGDSSLDHTDHEHLDLDEYLTAIDVLTGAVEELAAGLCEGAGSRTPAAEPQSDDGEDGPQDRARGSEVGAG